MVIRSYTADSVASALKQVRTDMGGNAVVLKTRVMSSGDSGKTYEVTACLDKPTVEQANQTLASKAPAEATNVVQQATGAAKQATGAAKQATGVIEENKTAAESIEVKPRVDLTEVATPSPAEPTEPTEPTAPTAPVETNRLEHIEAKLDRLLNIEKLDQISQRFVPEPISQAIRSMQAADMPELCITEIFDQLRTAEPESGIDAAAIRTALIKRLEASIEPEFDLQPGDRVMVAGPAGSGKTSLIGRLTAWLTLEKKTTVKLVSLDNVKVGALDEIASYADLLGIEEVDTPDKLKSDTGTADDDKVVLIDTCALPSDPEQLSELKTQMEQLKPTHRLAVFSTLTRSSDIENLAGRMNWLDATHLVFTMIDQTSSVGSLLAGAAAMDTRIALITNSPSGAESFQAPNAEMLADLILGREVDSE
jgi:flagellar biosynthesis protein FlhF